MDNYSEAPNISHLSVWLIYDDLWGAVGEGAERVLALFVRHEDQCQAEVNDLSDRYLALDA